MFIFLHLSNEKERMNNQNKEMIKNFIQIPPPPPPILYTAICLHLKMKQTKTRLKASGILENYEELEFANERERFFNKEFLKGRKYLTACYICQINIPFMEMKSEK